MAVNQLKALFEQPSASGGSPLQLTKSASLPRMQKNSTHFEGGRQQPRQVNKHPIRPPKEAEIAGSSAAGFHATPVQRKTNSLTRTIPDSAKLSSPLHMSSHLHRGISGTVTKRVGLNRPNSADAKRDQSANTSSSGLQRSGSAESLTSSNEFDERGRERLSRRTSSDEDLSAKMAATAPDTPPWTRAVLKKITAVADNANAPPTPPPAEGGSLYLEALKKLKKTTVDTSTPPLSPSPDELCPPPVGASTGTNLRETHSVDEGTVAEKLVDDAPELGSVVDRIGKWNKVVSLSLSERGEEDSDVSSEGGAGPEDPAPHQQNSRDSMDSPLPPCGEENGSPEPLLERCRVEEECVAVQAPASGPPDPAKIEKDRKRRQNIAQELLDTERTYASRLELISVKFYGAVMQFNAANRQLLPEASIQQIFLNIPQIYALSQNILGELQQRMDNWSTHEQLGDVLCRLAPFLKLYSTYTAGFEGAVRTLTEWTSKDRKFDALVKNFDRELGTGLGITSYMLEPIQRIPRYRLLLTDYVKHLPEDSPERTDSEKALGIISEAADRSNDRFKELETCNELLSIQRSLLDYDESLLAPGRSFLRKGLLNKESSKKGFYRHMFFLFSDLFLCTVPQSTHSFKLKYELLLKDMIIEDRKAAIFPHAFAVMCTTKSFVMGGSCEEEKLEWMGALQNAIQENRKRNSSLRRESRIFKEKNHKKLGSMAPIMINDKSVSMCQLCREMFTITFRRHHCRACGKVVCSNCLTSKAYLEYLKKEDKVCGDCRRLLQASQDQVKFTPPSSSHDKHEGVLDVKGYEDDAILATYVLLQDGKKWTRVWFQLKDDHVLYKFVAHEDVKAIDSKPLPGYSVTSDAATSQIRLTHPSQRKELCDTFKLDNQLDYDHWLEALQKAVQMDCPPSPVEPHPAGTI